MKKLTGILSVLAILLTAFIIAPPASAGPASNQPAQSTLSDRPVILVHGFISNYTAWNAYLGPGGFLAQDNLHGFAVGDGQAPGALNTGNRSDPALRTNTIAENAAILGEYIQSVKELTGADQVDLIGHSMGGLISRYYIDRIMKERDVAQLIVLGTPMAGSACANLPAALELYLPATLEIRPSYFEDIFNQEITERHGVPFYALAGTALTEPLKSPCTPVPSDLSVSLDSVNAISMELTEMEVLHTDMPKSPVVYQEFVRPLLLRATADIPEDNGDHPATAAAEDSQFYRMLTGHIDPGTSSELTINIETGVTLASFAMFDTTRTLTVTVTGASGKLIELSEDTNGLTVIDDPETLFYLGYGFTDPKPGVWKVAIHSSPQTPAEGADYALTARMVGGATVQASADPLLPLPGDPVNLVVRLSFGDQPLSILNAVASVIAPDGTKQTIQLSAAADGSQTASFTPDQEGLYSIDFQVFGTAADGTPLEKAAFLSVLSQPKVNPIQQYLTFGGIIAGVLILLVGGVIVSGKTLRRVFRRRK